MHNLPGCAYFAFTHQGNGSGTASAGVIAEDDRASGNQDPAFGSPQLTDAPQFLDKRKRFSPPSRCQASGKGDSPKPSTSPLLLHS